MKVVNEEDTVKEIRAYIKPHKLSQVTLALHKLEHLPGMSVSDVRGFGHAHEDRGRRAVAEDFVPHVKIEIMCNDDQVEAIIGIVEKAAHTGLAGDGKLYVSAIEQAVRIQTGERGAEAI
jgi:nitrogen regulatory protein P-II 1